MSLDTFDNELDELYNEDDNNCFWCDSQISYDKKFCSESCQNNYNLD